MPSVNLVVESKIKITPRVSQVCGLFDVPVSDKLREEWQAELPLDEKPWSIGLIVGPSGCGKSQIARHIWGKEKVDKKWAWQSLSVVDDIDKGIKIQQIGEMFSSVGFNAIPSWLKPFHVLSNGEKFRVECARLLLEEEGIIVIDEFTSVVDRQVAKIASYAVQKAVRKNNKQLVAISCHDDVIDWLNPDWIFRPATCEHVWRSLRPRPKVKIQIKKVHRREWRKFSKYHYMSADLNKSAHCFGAFLDGNIIGFTSTLNHPVPQNPGNPIRRYTRTVIHPDYQGLGVAYWIKNIIASMYSVLGSKIRSYPAHPQYIRSMAKDPKWKMVTRPGYKFGLPKPGKAQPKYRAGVRPNAVFEYIGPKFEDKDLAEKIIREKVI